MLGLGWGGGLIILFTSHNYALLFGLHGRQDRQCHDHYKSDGHHCCLHGHHDCHSHQNSNLQLSQFLRCFNLERKC